jgi:hypothetical protein
VLKSPRKELRFQQMLYFPWPLKPLLVLVLFHVLFHVRDPGLYPGLVPA